MENRPIEMLSVCGADGTLRPVRFRYEDEAHALETVQVSEVVSCKEVQYVGVEALIFLCRVRVAELERLLELKYTVRTHRWVLFRVVF